MTFKTWLRQFNNDDSYLGEFAEEYSTDTEFPRTKKLGKMMDYLFAQYVSLEVIKMFFETYTEYYKEKCR